MFNVHGWAYSSPYYIPSAWASALLILSQRQCESLNKRDKQSGRFPRSFYMLPSTQLMAPTSRESRWEEVAPDTDRG